MRHLAFLLGALMVLFGRGDLAPTRAGAAPAVGPDRDARRSTADPGHPRREVTTAVADTGGALSEIVLHFDPAAEAAVGPSYRDLLRALDPSVTLWVVVARRAHLRRFRELLRRWGVPRAERRVRPVVVGHSITTWSRDRYTLLRGPRPGHRRLLVRPRPVHGHPSRRNDWYAPFALARAAGPRVRIQVSPLVFDGGDLVVTRRHVFASALLLSRNGHGPLHQPRAVRRYLRRVTGREPVIFGASPETVPPHHLGMFFTPLPDGRRTVLVGDPRRGLARLTAAAEAQLPRPVLRDEAFLRRFDRIAREARHAGFRVVRTPLVPLADRVTYVTYNNVLFERRLDGRAHVYLPQFGLPDLDAAGRRAFEREGVVVQPVDVRGIYRHNGTVRCLVNVLRRLKTT